MKTAGVRLGSALTLVCFFGFSLATFGQESDRAPATRPRTTQGQPTTSASAPTKDQISQHRMEEPQSVATRPRTARPLSDSKREHNQSAEPQTEASRPRTTQSATTLPVRDNQAGTRDKPPAIIPDTKDLSSKGQPQEGEAEAEEDDEALIPPAPYIVKKDPKSISIPLEGIVRVPRFEQRPAISSNVKVGSVFGYRRDPFTRRARFHSGIDIKAKRGDAVGASQSGTVQFAGWYHGYGNLVIVDHGGGVTTYYAHLSSFAIEIGQQVVRGTIVGYAGSTGRATSPHLHYEVRIDGNAINPFQQVALDPSSPFFKLTRPTDVPGSEDPSSKKTGSQK